MKKAETNNTVKVHYTGKLQDGQIFDSSREREPLEFKLGEGKIIPGFENAVEGMQVSESKTVTVPSNEAYGPVQENLVQEIPSSALPKDIEPKIGQKLVSKHPNGQEIIVEVKKIKDEKITIDANHPLAGKDLVFDIELIEIL